MKKNYKKILMYVLVGVLVSSTVIGSYKKADEVKAVVIADDIIILAFILASCGVALSSTTLYQGLTDPTDYPAPDFKVDELGDMLTRLKAQELGYIDENGNPTGNYSPQEPEDPDPDDFNWEGIKANIQQYGLKSMVTSGIAVGIATLLVSDAAQQRADVISAGSSYNPDISYLFDSPYRRANYLGNTKTCRTTLVVSDVTTKVAFLNSGSGNSMFFVQDSTESPTSTFYYYLQDNSFYGKSNTSGFAKINGTNSSGVVVPYFYSTYSAIINGVSDSYIPVFSSGTAILDYFSSDTPNLSFLGDTNVTTSTAYDTATDKTKPIFPNLVLPTVAILTALLSSLKTANSDTDKKVATDEFIESLQNPETDPSTDPTTDPTTDPSVTPTPNPTISDFNPDNLKPETDFDGIKNKLNKLKLIFPWCIPFDLISGLRSMMVVGKAPYWELPLDVPTIGIHYVLVIDFEKFIWLAKVTRALLVASFLFGLMKITRALMIRG